MVGTFGRHKYLRHIGNVIGLKPDASIFTAMNVLLLPKRTLFVTDTYVNEDPSAEQLTEITLMAAEEVRRFGVAPKVALLSHSNFGTDDAPSALKMARALDPLGKAAPDLKIDGEMHGDTAMSETIRNHVNPDSKLRGEANLLIMPNLDAANIAFNLLKMIGGEGITTGAHPHPDHHGTQTGQHDRAVRSRRKRGAACVVLIAAGREKLNAWGARVPRCSGPG